MPKVSMTICLTEMPGVIAEMRREMAQVLHAVAEDEPPRVAERLHEIADAFAAGQRPEGY